MEEARNVTVDREAGSVSRSTWATLICAILPASMLMQMDKQAMVVLAPLVRGEFGFDLVTMTKMLGTTAWSYAAFQLPGAWLIAKIGPYRSLGMACLCWSAVVCLIPCSTTIAMFVAFRFLMGAAQSPDWTASLTIVKCAFPIALRSRASSLLLGALYAGAFIGGPLSVALATHWGWRSSFFLYGVVGLFYASLLLLSIRRLRSRLEGSRWQSTTVPAATGLFGALARSLQVHAQGLTYFCFSGVQSFFYVLFPSYLLEDRHLSMAAMGWLASLPLVALYVAVLFGGLLSDFLLKASGSIWWTRTPMVAVSVAGSALCFAGGMSSPDLVTLMLLVGVGMFLIGLGQVALWSTVQDLTTPAASGMVTAWTQFMGSISMGGVPVIAAYVARAAGSWADVRFVLIALGLLGAGAFLAVRPQHPLLLRR